MEPLKLEETTCPTCGGDVLVEGEVTKSYLPRLSKDILTAIWGAQYELNVETLKNAGENYHKICREHNPEWLLKYSRAQIHESIEFERELPYKWWKNNPPVDLDKAKEELIDELHFWVSKAQILGMNPVDVLDGYNKKNKINHERQEGEY